MSNQAVSTRHRPQQARSARTRAVLLDTVERIVATEGAPAVTTTRIAAEAGLSVGALYRYFPDRDALLLAAYDATVDRVVDACSVTMRDLPDATEPDTAARLLLGRYLQAASGIQAHAGLLRAMRAIRPVEADQATNEDRIVSDILAPFLVRFLPAALAAGPDRLHFLNVLIGTMVDLYLVTEGDAARAAIRDDMEAHMLLALRRSVG